MSGRFFRRLAGVVALSFATFVALVLARHAPLYDGLAPRRIEREANVGARADASRRVVLISIDGLAPRVLAATETPTLDRLAREGAVATDARTVVPSITMAAHTTMLTGLAPEAHGVRWNRYQPWSPIPQPTIFTRCGQAGLRCGLVAGKLKFARFAEEEAGVHHYAYAASASEVLNDGAGWLQGANGDFLMVHLAEVDRAGHEHGWDSGAQRAALTEIDRLLAGFVDALQADGRRTLLLITSDHGGEGTTHGRAIEADVLIPFLLWGDGIPAGAVIGTGVDARDTAPTVLAALGLAIPADWPGHERLPVSP